MIMSHSPFLYRHPNDLRRLVGLVLLVVLAIIALHPHLAWAADQQMLTLADIKAKAGDDTDTSRWIFHNLLGDFGSDPFSVIGQSSTTLIGGMFFLFNAALFAIGAAYVGWTVVTQIVVSANAGEVLGRQMSGVWLPVRIGTGTFGMLPVFGGFSLAQAVMMFAAILGIGMANLLSDVAIQKTADFNSVIPPPGLGAPSSAVKFSPSVGETVFLMNVCSLAANQYMTWTERASSGPFTQSQTFYDSTTQAILTKGMSDNCGSVKLNDETPRTNGDSVLSGYRNNAIQYDTIASLGRAVRSIRASELQSLQDKMLPVAKAWFDAYVKNTDVKGSPGQAQPGSLAYPRDAILQKTQEVAKDEHDKVVAEYNANWKGSEQNKAISDKVMENMGKGGWMSLGSWYQTFGEANAALQSAASSTWLNVNPPAIDPKQGNEYVLAVMNALSNSEQKDVAGNGGCAISSLMWVQLDTPTGNCSFGQNLTMMIINSVSQGSGGANMINPITTSKEMGDVMLDLLGTAAIVKVASNVKPLGIGAVLSKITDQFTGDGIVSKVSVYVFTALFFVGVMLAVYIPFVPFISWFTALVGYFASVLEGLAAAEVWAFSHLHSEGEGMGQQTRQGYIYLLNMLLRPALMVLGFFFATAICTLLGTFFINQLPSVLANVQGNSSTGPFIMFGILSIVVIVLLMLIQGSFNLIHEIPDRVIAWFGSHIQAGSFARHMDGQIDSKTEQITRWGNRGLIEGAAGQR